MRLDGKRVLITGTAGGQGEAAQAMFAREGARIVGCDVQPGAAEKTADALRALGYDVTGHTVDLADNAAASVINTASMSGVRGIAPLGQAAHAAAKGGVIGLTKTLAAEGAAEGIRANVISPGFVASPATDAAVGDQLRAFQLGMHLNRRPGRGDDIAYLAVYLASDESSWVTGQNSSVDGGVTAGFR
ncbi:MAG TPA: SDR family oxidoreductase [Pseudonocardia sp.]|nr:SDR family oxidoreductase [Pseudonocardia sp.]